MYGSWGGAPPILHIGLSPKTDVEIQKTAAKTVTEPTSKRESRSSKHEARSAKHEFWSAKSVSKNRSAGTKIPSALSGGEPYDPRLDRGEDVSKLLHIGFPKRPMWRYWVQDLLPRKKWRRPGKLRSQNSEVSAAVKTAIYQLNLFHGDFQSERLRPVKYRLLEDHRKRFALPPYIWTQGIITRNYNIEVMINIIILFNGIFSFHFNKHRAIMNDKNQTLDSIIDVK